MLPDFGVLMDETGKKGAADYYIGHPFLLCMTVV